MYKSTGFVCARALSSSWPQIIKRTMSSSADKQHIIVALGGNALLKRGEPMTAGIQRKNIADCVSSMVSLLKNNKITLVHGNGPQVGLLALQNAEYQKATGAEPMELDVLDAETEGMIGYLIEQEICAQIGRDRGVVTVLSQIIVDGHDPAFQNPTKFIGPIYTEEEAAVLPTGKVLKKDGDYWRQVVASPLPVRLVDQQMHAVRLLTDNDCIVICAGGGGIPVVEDVETNRLRGVEAVIDKDRAAAMLAKILDASGLLILTDVKGAAVGFRTSNQKWIKSASPEKLQELMYEFPAGSMGPKVESAVEFVQQTGGWGRIGSLNEVEKVMSNETGTLITTAHGKDHLRFY